MKKILFVLLLLLITNNSYSRDYGDVNIKGTFSVEDLDTCNTIDTDGSGVLRCGTDAVDDAIANCTNVNACTIDAESMEGTDWGTLTNAKWCVYDSAGTEVDCIVEPVVNTDDQTIDVFSFSDPNISLSLEDDGEATKTLDISGLNIDPDNLDDEDQGDVNISSDTWQVQEVQSGAISEAADIDNDIITHAQIADADQTITLCIWFEDPTADDDFNSIWANKTANDFLLTELWAESDQTVTFMLQVDDGTPSDIDTVDLAPAAGEAEDTSLDGDTTVAAGEELDLAITSVASTPTWVSICWTGNWVD